MGNCLRHDSGAQWGGEDWTPAMMNDIEKSGETMEDNKMDCSTIKEVKVKITKKQLEELLGKMSMDLDVQNHGGISAGQILGQLVRVSVHCETTHLKSWKPRLQSIPEV
ncbi:uncharacterized protein LOC110723612 [Chenopodium quinoa]|uniref:uncharacterized protein LOC110723612 n=1 Tax=Chenopodium quinoa TaxID=63459 RepID=UPI000B78EAD1|nr:uncharacterized protein LOC110723612 [Chenopodium quinoa]